MTVAKDLHMSVIADGIETEEQVRARRECGVEDGRGYIVSPPVPPAKFIELIEDPASEVGCPEALREAGHLTSTEIPKRTVQRSP
jgi:sensor c-di-GMP phosphodiesterase-like protein